jgi:hypothetical protein
VPLRGARGKGYYEVVLIISRAFMEALVTGYRQTYYFICMVCTFFKSFSYLTRVLSLLVAPNAIFSPPSRLSFQSSPHSIAPYNSQHQVFADAGHTEYYSTFMGTWGIWHLYTNPVMRSPGGSVLSLNLERRLAKWSAQRWYHQLL